MDDSGRTTRRIRLSLSSLIVAVVVVARRRRRAILCVCLTRARASTHARSFGRRQRKLNESTLTVCFGRVVVCV